MLVRSSKIAWILLLLLAGLAACDGLSEPQITLVPTAVPPSMSGQISSAGDLSLPPTWTHTPEASPTEAPDVSKATMVPYERTATPTRPSATPTATPTASNTPTPTPTFTPWPTILPTEVWSLEEYPKPPNDNGWGMHWFSTYEQEVDVINRFVVELQRMHIRWLVFLNDGTDIGRNDYLVKRLVSVGIEPIMRLYLHGVVPYEGNLAACVHHYHLLGVNYFQIYNEPNLYAEAAGRVPNPDWYVTHWAQAAEVVAANGGLPGFGALSPGGEYSDLAYLRGALQSLKRRKQEHLLNRGWFSLHNYAQYQPVNSTDGFLRYQLYNQIIVEELGRPIPILGTEAGHYGDTSEQFLYVSEAYRYMAQREEYFFCYTYWLLGNEIGGSWDTSFEYQVLFRSDGYVNPLVAGLFYRGP